MKEHIQTVINICLAIFITVYIIDNNKLNDKIDSLEAEIFMIKERIGIEAITESKFGGKPVYYSVNERLRSYALKVIKN